MPDPQFDEEENKVKALVALLVVSSMAFASEITITSVTASSTFGYYNVTNLINGAGLSGDLHDGEWGNKWMSNAGAIPAWLIFDLGTPYSVAGTSIWNYGPGCCGNGRSTRDLTVSWSSDGGTYTPLGGFVLNQYSTVPFPADSLALGVTARYIRFDLLSTYGDGYIGLSEVKFYDTAAVPEPGTVWLAAAGIGLIALVQRKRGRR